MIYDPFVSFLSRDRPFALFVPLAKFAVFVKLRHIQIVSLEKRQRAHADFSRAVQDSSTHISSNAAARRPGVMLSKGRGSIRRRKSAELQRSRSATSLSRPQPPLHPLLDRSVPSRLNASPPRARRVHSFGTRAQRRNTELFTASEIPPELRHLPRHLARAQMRREGRVSGDASSFSPSPAPAPSSPSSRQMRLGASAGAPSTPSSTGARARGSESKRQPRIAGGRAANGRPSKEDQQSVQKAPAAALLEKAPAARVSASPAAAVDPVTGNQRKPAKSMSSSELRALAASLREQAADAKIGMGGTLAVKLGEKITNLLEERNQTAVELFNEWDIDGDGSISRTEFTLIMRRLRLVGDPDIPEAMFKMRSLSKEDSATVDALFDNLDLDGMSRAALDCLQYPSPLAHRGAHSSRIAFLWLSPSLSLSPSLPPSLSLSLSLSHLHMYICAICVSPRACHDTPPCWLQEVAISTSRSFLKDWRRF